MKRGVFGKIVSFALMLSLGMCFSGCNERGTSETEPLKQPISDLERYDMEKYLEPVWEGDHVYAETAMLLKDKEGKIPDVSLYYPIEEIVSVRSFGLDTLYTENVDYRVTEEGKLEILETGALYEIACEYGDYYQERYISGVNWPAVDGGAQMKTEAENGEAGLTKYQISVTYRHKGAYEGEKPSYKGDKIPETVYKLERKERLSVVCLGDSISAGWTASGYEWVNLKPYMPMYFELVTDYLKDHYGNSSILRTNLSVGGMTSSWGKESTQIYNATERNPDLMIIAFGMNDGSDASFSAAAFKGNIAAIIEGVRAKCPQTEFILVSTMLPNREVGYNTGVSILQNQAKYLPVLLELERETEGVAVADVTSVHAELMEKKNFRDMSSNNINHPNDFMQRVYAQVILKTLVADY